MATTEFPRFTTVSGSEVILYSMGMGGDFPLHGAYNSGTEQGWLPVAWTEEGKIRFNSIEHPLDILWESLAPSIAEADDVE